MTISEKRVESSLDTILKSNGFNPQYIFYSPHENPILKEMFKSASKSGNGGGIPDRIYFDGTTLIIIECKTADMTCAIRDLKLYASKINCEYRLFFVAFCKDTYRIFTAEFKELYQNIRPETFDLTVSDTCKMSIFDMEKDIRRIHNYIRDYTKISNEDKSFFIASILISLKKPSFRSIISSYDTKEYVYDLIKQNLTDYGIDVSVFEFLRNDQNNIYFLEIIKMVMAVYSRNPSIDLLNKFYSEFVKYSNSDSKSLGIVLTPHHIVSLMIELLDINDKDVFLDLCSGTGSFAIEANRHTPSNLICCEYQNKLFTLLKCNMILRDCKGVLIKDNCFQQDFTQYHPTKSAINPPYGMKGAETELAFILKQLESLEEGGLACAIIPKSKLNSNKINDTYKQRIMNIADIKCVINCNPELFMPSASVDCCIILLEKCKNKGMYKLIDYTDDGMETMIRNGKVQHSSFDDKYNQVLHAIRNNDYIPLQCNMDWAYQTPYVTTSDVIDLSFQQLEKLNLEYELKKQEIMNNPKKITLHNTVSFKIGDLFTLKRGINNKELKAGIYPYVSASYKNNGISKYVDKFLYRDCITVSNNGSIAEAFYQHGEFNCSSDVTVLLNPVPMIDNVDVLKFICILIRQYKNIYNYGRKWSLARMKNDTIRIPMKGDSVDMDCILSVLNA